MSKVGKNVFSLVFSKLLASVIVFVGYALLFRYFGTTKTGQYQFVLSYVTLFSIVVDFGISQLVIKKVSENTEEAKKYLGNFFAVEIILALVIYIVLGLIPVLRGYEPIVRYAILVTGFGMFLNALSIPYAAIISAYQDMHKIAVVNFFDSVINVALMLLVITLHRSIVFLCMVQMFMGIMHLVVYYFLIKKYVPRAAMLSYIPKLDFGLIKYMIITALPFGMLVSFSVVYNKIDVLILTKLTDYAQTGLYTAAYKFFDVLAFLPAVVSSSLYPFFSAEMARGNVSGVKDALAKYTRYMIGLAVPIAFGGAVLAPKLILAVGGQQFYPGFTAIQILVFASATLFIYSAANSLMINQFTKLAVYVTFANIFINSIGNFILIPHFGFRAAATMTLVSELTQAIFYFYFVRSRVGSFPFWKGFAKPIVCAAIMAIVLYPLRFHSLLITLPLGIVVYTVLIFATKFISAKDLKLIKSIISRESPVQTENA